MPVKRHIYPLVLLQIPSVATPSPHRKDMKHLSKIQQKQNIIAENAKSTNFRM